MRQFVHQIGIAAAALCLVACSTVHVSDDHDRSADLSVYRSYAWLPPGRAVKEDLGVTDDLFDQQVRHAIASEMVARGIAETDAESADCLLRYHASAGERFAVLTYRDGYDARGQVGFAQDPWSETQLYAYEEGTLVLDIVDRGTRKVVWQGRALAAIGYDESPQASDARTRQGVADMLDNFPPE